MRRSLAFLLVVLVASLLAIELSADIYMQSPNHSNNRVNGSCAGDCFAPADDDVALGERVQFCRGVRSNEPWTLFASVDGGPPVRVGTIGEHDCLSAAVPNDPSLVGLDLRMTAIPLSGEPREKVYEIVP